MDPPARHVSYRAHQQAQLRKARFLEVYHQYFREGRTDALRAAAVEVGWAGVRTYRAARERDMRFAAAVDAIRGSSTGRPSQRKQLAAVAKERRRREIDAELAAQYPTGPPIVLPLPEDPEKGEIGWSGFAGFRRVFFGMETYWFQQQIIDKLEKAKEGTVTLILIPPAHGKTTLLEDWIGFKLALLPDFRIIYASEGQKHTRKVIKRVKNRMHPQGPFRDYVARFGPFVPQVGADARPQTWAADEFDVWRRSEFDERDHSMVGLGFGSNVAGSRCDLLVVDDVQSLKSINQTDQIIEEFRQDWLSRPEHGYTVVLGTRVGDNDVYQKMMDEGIVDEVVKIPAVQPSTGDLLWPEQYDRDWYDNKRKKVGESAWARNFMQQPTAAGERTFEGPMLAAASDSLLQVGRKPAHRELRSCIVGHDPGFGTNAVFVAGVTETQFVALDWRTDRGLTSTAQMAQVLDDVMDHWTRQGVRVAHLVIEDKYVGQGLMNDDAFLDLTRRYGCSLSGHKTSLSKIDDDLGVAAMARSFRVGEVVLPGADDPDTQRQRAALDAELHAWRPMVRGAKLRQDLVMAMWFCWMRWRTERRNASSDDRTHLIRTNGLGGIPAIKFVPVVNPKGPLVGAR